MIYTSRYGNPALKTGDYTTVRISLGKPKWNIGYPINAELPDLMPAGIFGEFDVYEDFREAYFERLDNIGVQRIKTQLDGLSKLGKDVVLLCFEDVRKVPKLWCHREAFAEWWDQKTGEKIPELPDPSPVPVFTPIPEPLEQLSLF